MASLKTLQTKTNKLLLMQETRAIRELAQNYAMAADAIRDELAKLYERYAVSGKLTHAEMSKYNRLSALEKQLRTEVKPVALANNRLLDRLAQIQYEESFYRHAWAIDNTIGVRLRWGLLSPDQVKAAVANDLRHLAKWRLSEETLIRVRRAVSQGLIRGQSMRGMMIGVREALEASNSDAMRIARTEAHRAREQGHLAVTQRAEDIGVRLTRVWVASLDDRTRSSHAHMDGAEEKDWRLGGIKPAYPGDPALPAEESINCRCTTYDKVEGYEPEVRRTRDAGVEPYQNFEAWAKSRGVDGSRYGEKYNFTAG